MGSAESALNQYPVCVEERHAGGRRERADTDSATPRYPSRAGDKLRETRLRESRVRAFVAGSSAEMKERLMRAFDPAGILRQVLDTRRACERSS
jgi:hypothetical protein